MIRYLLLSRRSSGKVVQWVVEWQNFTELPKEVWVSDWCYAISADDAHRQMLSGDFRGSNGS